MSHLRQVRNYKRLIAPITYIVSSEDDVIDVDTTNGLATIYIPNIEANATVDRKIYINDATNNAQANPITVVCIGGNTINNLPLLPLGVDGISAQIIIVDRNRYMANLNTDSSSGGGGTIGGGGNLGYVAVFTPDGVHIGNAPMKIGTNSGGVLPTNSGEKSVVIGYNCVNTADQSYVVGNNNTTNGSGNFVFGFNVNIDDTFNGYGSGRIFSVGSDFSIVGGANCDAIINLSMGSSINATSGTRAVYLFGYSHICNDFVTYSTLIGESCNFTRVDHSMALGIFTTLTDVTNVYTYGESNTIDNSTVITNFGIGNNIYNSTVITNFGIGNNISSSTNLGVFGNYNVITDSNQLYLGNNNLNITIDFITGRVLALYPTSLDPSVWGHTFASPSGSAKAFSVGTSGLSQSLFDVYNNGSFEIGHLASAVAKFSFNGTETFSFSGDVAQAVGVNTTSPAQTLHVEAPVGGYGIRASTGAVYVDIVPNGSNFIEFLTNRAGYELISDGANLRLTRSGATGQSLIYGNNLDAISIGDNTGTPIMTALYSNNSVGIGTSSPTARLHIAGSDDTVANYALRVQNSIGSNLFNVRNDGFVGINATTTLNPFGLGNFGLRSSYLWVDWFDTTDTDTGIVWRKDSDDASAVVFGTKNWAYGIDGSKTASIKLNNANGFMSFGGYGYSQQKFDFELNYQNTNIGTPQRFAVNCGLHTIGTGGNIAFYGAPNSASNTSFSYASIYGVKENVVDSDFKGKLSLRVNDGATNHVEVERMSIASNGQVNINFLQDGGVGLISGDIYYDSLDGNRVKYVP